ncbi:MAG TPA: hypothetical protein PKC87_00995 [Candidatus Absconditabacterales bacterium]|nr:hypothetical protein [Candidatus Absconditabacterales bacterium]
MKIFSNFNTDLRQRTFEEYQIKYGIDKVLCFGRSRLYQFYRVIFPLIGLLLLTAAGLMFFYRRLDGQYFTYILIAIFILFVVFFFPIAWKHLDYKMDFIIVVPDSIMMYDQGGILKRDVITINAQSIKTISVKKSGLLYSIFDNGDIIILAEGDTERNGETILRRVPRPEKRRNQMLKIIGIDLQANQNPHT